VRQDKTMRSSE